MSETVQVAVVGAGAFGTAFASKLAANPKYRVVVLGRNAAVTSEINVQRTNSRYLGNAILCSRLQASTDPSILTASRIVFLALPSAQIVRFVEEHSSRLRDDALVANLAKGYVSGGRGLIADHLRQRLPANMAVAAVKGPTFSVEMLSALRSGFTVAVDPPARRTELVSLFEGSGILLDFADSIHEVECLSVLKNVYAIALGIVEARYSNPNLQAVVLTRSILEIRDLAAATVGHPVDVLKYCGVGDFLLTSLNDQSRNRTLGLMIGKGFIDTRSGTHSVIVEGLRSIDILGAAFTVDELEGFPILAGLTKYLRQEIDLSGFLKALLD